MPLNDAIVLGANYCSLLPTILVLFEVSNPNFFCRAICDFSATCHHLIRSTCFSIGKPLPTVNQIRSIGKLFTNRIITTLISQLCEMRCSVFFKSTYKTNQARKLSVLVSEVYFWYFLFLIKTHIIAYYSGIENKG